MKPIDPSERCFLSISFFFCFFHLNLPLLIFVYAHLTCCYTYAVLTSPGLRVNFRYNSPRVVPTQWLIYTGLAGYLDNLKKKNHKTKHNKNKKPQLVFQSKVLAGFACDVNVLCKNCSHVINK